MINGTASNIMLKVEDALCRACKICPSGELCRGNAFRRFEREEAPFIDMSRCWGCLDCLPACPHGAVVEHTWRS